MVIAFGDAGLRSERPRDAFRPCEGGMLDATDREMKPWIDGTAELKDLQEQLIDLTGLKIQAD